MCVYGHAVLVCEYLLCRNSRSVLNVAFSPNFFALHSVCSPAVLVLFLLSLRLCFALKLCTCCMLEHFGKRAARASAPSSDG